jgi:hypothetical protein
MTMVWTRLIVALAMIGAVLVLSACQSRPGDNAYGRYPHSSGTMKPTDSDEDWWKDIGV